MQFSQFMDRTEVFHRLCIVLLFFEGETCKIRQCEESHDLIRVTLETEIVNG